MARKPHKWITFVAEKFVHDALKQHRDRLKRERGGQEVSISEAARDAILRTRGAES